MVSVLKTISLGAFSLLLSCISPNASQTSLRVSCSSPEALQALRPLPSGSLPVKGCTRLETVVRREAAGIPREYAAASRDLINRLDPKFLRYDCSVIRTKDGGTFDKNRSYDIFTFIKRPKVIWLDYAGVFNAISEGNISRGHAPLSDDWVRYIVKTNMMYAAQKNKLDLEFKASDLHIIRDNGSDFTVKPSLKGVETRRFLSMTYDISGWSYCVRLAFQKYFSVYLGVEDLPEKVYLPIFPEIIVPYVVLKPADK